MCCLGSAKLREPCDIEIGCSGKLLLWKSRYLKFALLRARFALLEKALTGVRVASGFCGCRGCCHDPSLLKVLVAMIHHCWGFLVRESCSFIALKTLDSESRFVLKMLDSEGRVT